MIFDRFYSKDNGVVDDKVGLSEHFLQCLIAKIINRRRYSIFLVHACRFSMILGIDGCDLKEENFIIIYVPFSFQVCNQENVELVYVTYHVDVGETPFFIGIDYDMRKIVISIRGTLSMKV